MTEHANDIQNDPDPIPPTTRPITAIREALARKRRENVTLIADIHHRGRRRAD